MVEYAWCVAGEECSKEERAHYLRNVQEKDVGMRNISDRCFGHVGLQKIGALCEELTGVKFLS